MEQEKVEDNVVDDLTEFNPETKKEFEIRQQYMIKSLKHQRMKFDIEHKAVLQLREELDEWKDKYDELIKENERLWKKVNNGSDINKQEIAKALKQEKERVDNYIKSNSPSERMKTLNAYLIRENERLNKELLTAKRKSPELNKELSKQFFDYLFEGYVNFIDTKDKDPDEYVEVHGKKLYKGTSDYELYHRGDY